MQQASGYYFISVYYNLRLLWNLCNQAVNSSIHAFDFHSRQSKSSKPSDMRYDQPQFP